MACLSTLKVGARGAVGNSRVRRKSHRGAVTPLFSMEGMPEFSTGPEDILKIPCLLMDEENFRLANERNTGQRAVLKFAAVTGATPIAARFTPGTFTNQIQAAFQGPRLLGVTDPRAADQPLTEVLYVNPPTTAPCNTDSPLRPVDTAILAATREFTQRKF
eukprot:bmy_00818T0